jgi:hypothetical protein
MACAIIGQLAIGCSGRRSAPPLNRTVEAVEKPSNRQKYLSSFVPLL